MGQFFHWDSSVFSKQIFLRYWLLDGLLWNNALGIVTWKIWITENHDFKFEIWKQLIDIIRLSFLTNVTWKNENLGFHQHRKLHDRALQDFNYNVLKIPVEFFAVSWCRLMTNWCFWWHWGAFVGGINRIVVKSIVKASVHCN